MPRKDPEHRPCPLAREDFCRECLAPIKRYQHTNRRPPELSLCSICTEKRYRGVVKPSSMYFRGES